MDYELTDEQKELQKKWTDFYRDLMKDAPKEWRDAYGAEAASIYGDEWAENIWPQWNKDCWDKQREAGMLALHWPKEYGGQDLGPVEQFLLSEIVSYYRIPQGNWAGYRLLAPSILEFGTEEQKQEFLPKILTGETWFAQVWSEPNAGSDLASLTTRAVRDGDDYIVNGQKTWISSAFVSNWGHSPIRTDPDETKRHRGLSYFMYPFDTPGVTIKPVYALDHRIRWGEVYFDDVRIPEKYRVGEENRGWYVTMATANSERSGAVFGTRKRDIEDITRYCIETKRGGKRLIDDPFIREGLADLEIMTERLRALCYRSVWEQSKGEEVTKYASSVKIIQTELLHKISTFVAYRLGGLYGQLRYGSELAPFEGVFESLWEGDIGQITNIGSNDIQHNVIANRGLSLPRE